MYLLVPIISEVSFDCKCSYTFLVYNVVLNLTFRNITISVPEFPWIRQQVYEDYFLCHIAELHSAIPVFLVVKWLHFLGSTL